MGVMTAKNDLDFAEILDCLEQGLLIFDETGQLIYHNQGAQSILGRDLETIRAKGWPAAAALFNTRQTNPDDFLDAVRERAQKSQSPVRFHVFLSGESVPCSMV